MPRFGIILPSVIENLKAILDQYPDDGQILKELIQNAEDAGAKVVRFLLDKTSYPCNPEKLAHPDLQCFQGPALYAFNDVVFKDEDWIGIRSLLHSLKKDDPIKVGRFGMGFKSVFHFTDLPSIVSGEYVGVIDPHQRYFNVKGRPETGIQWYLNDRKNQNDQDIKKAVQSDFPHQFAPYKDQQLSAIFNNINDAFDEGHYNGTLFRFPLRTTEADSELSSKEYTTKNIEHIFEQFKTKAYMSLLFLKSLEKIEIYEREPNEKSPHLIFKVEIDDECIEEVRNQRQCFQNTIEPTKWMQDPVTAIYQMQIKTSKIVSKNALEEEATEEWLVADYYVGGDDVSDTFKKLSTDAGLGYVPWVSVAMNLKDSRLNPVDEVPVSLEPEGHVFCFLPLPLEQQSISGLPIHVNGYFAISQNRRHIKWPSADQKDEITDDSLLWNLCMVQEALPRAYIELIASAIEKKVHKVYIYHAIPDEAKVRTEWKNLLHYFYDQLQNKDFLHTPSNGGKWVGLDSALIDFLDEENKLSERNAILKILYQANKPVAVLPDHIKAYADTKSYHIKPIHLREALLQIQDQAFFQDMPSAEKMRLLHYLLTEASHMLVIGLDLLPLSNGQFVRFQCKENCTSEEIIFVPSEEHPAHLLLPGLENHLIADSKTLTSQVLAHLRKMADKAFTQLQWLKTADVIQLLPFMFPPAWRSHDLVPWNPDKSQLTLEWMKAVWTYLKRQCPDDLSQIEDLHLLPVKTEGSLQIRRLGPANTSTMVLDRPMDKIKPSIKSLMEEMGCTIVQEIPKCILDHPKGTNYINDTSTLGILKALSNLYRKNSNIFQSLSRNTSACEALSKFFAHGDSATLRLHRKLLCCLPLFSISFGNGKTGTEMKSVNELKQSAPKEELPVPSDMQMLYVSDEESKILASEMNVTPVLVTQLLLKHVLPTFSKLSPDDQDKLLTHIFERMALYTKENKTFATEMSSFAILRRSDGQLKKPMEIFDPMDEQLKIMFAGQTVFPQSSHVYEKFNPYLKELGMKSSRDVKASHIIEAAEWVEQNKEFIRSKEKVTGLLQFMSNNPHLFKNKDKRRLSTISWIPAIAKKPELYPCSLMWFCSEQLFLQPSKLISEKHSLIIGSVSYVVSLDVSVILPCRASPNLNEVISHLSNVVQSYSSEEKALYMRMVVQIYNYLQEHDVKCALKYKQLEKWVWNGDGFSSPGHVILHKPQELSKVDLTPYVYTLPKEMEQYAGFFRSLGTTDMTVETIVLAVQEVLHKKYEGGKEQTKESKNEDLHLFLDLLTALKRQVHNNIALSEETKQKLMIPVLTEDDTLLQLKPLGECAYSDKDWLTQGHHEDETEDSFYFVHHEVPNDTAEALGVSTLMSRMLDAEELNEMGGIDSYGQYEPLTTRLNRLLKDYTDGFAVPKELVQNADDAGATEVCFLYDERRNTNARERLFDPKMAECQGPALWAYNNSTFTDADFENITKLSGATKEDDLEKIGRFGLGFNAVYNLTDVPSFISRHNIIFFDPHTKYLGKAIQHKSSPGIKLDMRSKASQRRLKMLANQFQPYHGIFNCDLTRQTSFNGTLFRFPLRTTEQAKSSDISHLAYDGNEMEELIEKFREGASTLLLFTQNVTEVTLYHLPENEDNHTNMTQLFKVTKKQLRILRSLQTRTDTVLKISAKVLKDIKQNITTVKYPCSSEILSIEESDFLDTSHCSSNKGHSATWLISSCMGERTSLEMAKRKKNLIPVAGVAVLLDGDIDSGCKPVPLYCPDTNLCTGQFFCFLPLPVDSHLPVHVNGTFGVTASRRHLCEKTSDEKRNDLSEWNQALFEDAVAKAYIMMLEDVKSVCQVGSFEYHALWPMHLFKKSSPTYKLLEGIYKAIFNESGDAKELLSDGVHWKNVKAVASLDTNLSTSTLKPSAEFIMRAHLEHIGCILVEIPKKVMKAINYAGCSITDRMFDKKRFFLEIVFPNISNIPEGTRNEVVIFALENMDASDEEQQILMSLDCIPTTPNGQILKCPKDLIHPHGKAAQVYAEDDMRFPHGKFTSQKILYILETLGMQKDSLQRSDLVERACSVEPLYQYDLQSGIDRIRNLLKLMVNCTTDIYLETDLRGITFLPALAKPPGYPIEWKGNHMNLCSPDELYLQKHETLVSATKPILDQRVGMDFTVVKFLKMDKRKPDLDIVLQQLDVTIESMGVSPEMTVEMTTICKDIYTFIQSEMLNKSESENFKNDLVDQLKRKRFIFIPENATFVSIQQVSFDEKESLAPYLFSLGRWGIEFSYLMSTVGVKTAFNTREYHSALQLLYQDVRNAKLQEYQLDLACKLAHLLAESLKTQLKGKSDSHAEFAKQLRHRQEYGDIYLPNKKQVLQPAQDLCFDDCPWISDASLPFLHPNITLADATILGAMTKRGKVLQKSAVGIPFGQKEKLTNRIKRILEGYACTYDVLKELLQNADDARATEINFIKDDRNHPTEKVFEKSWESLQGPALCVYNNSPFTIADLQGIQNLGEGSKSDDPNKTGQYGVGFNAVYHLTDVPSFITSGSEISETLIVFDPHCAYVPGTTPAEPGMKYDDLPQKKEIFPDVFECYLLDQLPIENATLFRFPLRTEELASRSDIKRIPISPDGLDEMMQSFKDEAFECLLFLNNIEKIAMSEVSGNGKIKETFRVEVELDEEARRSRSEFFDYVRKVSSQIKNGNLIPQDIKPTEFSYVLTLKGSADGVTDRHEEWLIVQRIGFGTHNDMPEGLKLAAQRGDIGLLPRGGVACLLSSDMFEVHPSTSTVYCFLPLPVKAPLPVCVNGHFALDHETRRNICDQGGSVVKTEWNKQLMIDVIATSYMSLLTHVQERICKSNMIVNRHHSVTLYDSNILNDLMKYKTLFPLVEEREVDLPKENLFDSLCKSVYKIINERGLRLLPVINPIEMKNETSVYWMPACGTEYDAAYFDNFPHILSSHSVEAKLEKEKKHTKGTPDKTGGKYKEIRETLLNCRFNLLWHKFSQLFEYFKRSGVEVQTVTPLAVLKFFKSYNSDQQLCLITDCVLPAPVQDTKLKSLDRVRSLLEYCKDAEEFYNHLDGLPLLVTEDHYLTSFNENSPVFLSSYSILLPKSRHKFVHSLLHGAIFNHTLNSKVFKRFTTDDLANELPSQLGEQFRGFSSVPWNPGKHDSVPNGNWIYKLWKFVENEHDNMVTSNRNKFDANIFNAILSPLDEWCLFPAVETKRVAGTLKPTALLTKTSRRMFALDGKIYREGSIEAKMVMALKSLGIQELNYLALKPSPQSLTNDTNSTELYYKLRSVCASLENPASILDVIEEMMQLSEVKDKLDNIVAITILQYLSSCIKCLSIDTNITNRLRDLPLYPSSHDDRLIALTGLQVYVLPGDIPSTDVTCWEPLATTAFIRHRYGFDDLLRFIQCTFISEADMYMNFILKQFYLLTENEQQIHMHYVKDKLIPSLWKEEDAEAKKRLYCTLGSVPFIQGKKASDFYDPRNQIFMAMLDKTHFPPSPYDVEYDRCKTKDWLPFLRNIGLVVEVTSAKFIEFAQKLAHLGTTNECDVKQIKEKSEILIRHLFLRKNLATDAYLLQSVKEIAFVPPQFIKNEYTNIACTTVQSVSQHFVCFALSIPHSNFDDANMKLAWSSAAFLPPWANPEHYHVSGDYEKGNHLNYPFNYKERITDALDLRSKPTTEQVVKHCKNICEAIYKGQCSQAKMVHKTNVLLDVMKTVYRFLSETNRDRSCIQGLERSPCILVNHGGLFIYPWQMAVDMLEEEEIKPYLYKVPSEISEFSELFQFLGSPKRATVSQYVMVLEELHKECQDIQLHPNELKFACRAMKGLLTKPTEEIRKKVCSSSPLYLLSRNKKLVSSNLLVYADDPSLHNRIRDLNQPVLIDLKECEIMNDSLHVVHKLPDFAQPKMLSDIVEECLEDDCDVSVDDNAEAMQLHIRDERFCNGIVRLLRHDAHEKSQEVIEVIEDEVKDKLKNIVVYQVTKLMTYLRDEAGQRIVNSEQNKPCFIQKTKALGTQTLCKLHIQFDLDVKMMLTVVAKELCDILELTSYSALYLREILDLPLSRVMSVLDDFGIRTDNLVSSSSDLFPEPGDYIHRDDHHLLIQALNHVFEPHEYVGYEIDDPSLRDEDGEATYVYAIIVKEVGTSEHPFTKRYMIRIGREKEDKIVAPATSLYMFYRPPRKESNQIVVSKQSSTEFEESPATQAKTHNDLESAKTDVKSILKTAFGLSELERKKVIKRLYLQWHPDKNKGNEDFCTEVFKFIQREIERLENPCSSTADYSGSWFTSNSSFYASFRRWNTRASFDGSRRHTYSSSGSSYGYYGFTNFNRERKNPQPNEAKRWFRQANEDYNAVQNDLNGIEPSPVWACFKCHQAAEKALKAAQYAVDANLKSNSHHLSLLTSGLSDDLGLLASQLQGIVGESTTMRYPDRTPGCIPSDLYDRGMADQAQRLANGLLDKVVHFLEKHEVFVQRY